MTQRSMPPCCRMSRLCSTATIFPTHQLAALSRRHRLRGLAHILRSPIQVSRRDFRLRTCHTSKVSSVLQKPRLPGIWISTSLVSLISFLSSTGPLVIPLASRSISLSASSQPPISTKIIRSALLKQDQVINFHFIEGLKMHPRMISNARSAGLM
jgi:hypothetical protein